MDVLGVDQRAELVIGQSVFGRHWIPYIANSYEDRSPDNSTTYGWWY